MDFEQLQQDIKEAGDISALPRSRVKEIQTQLAESGLYVDGTANIDGIAGPLTNHALALLDEDFARNYLAGMALTDNDLSKTDLQMMQAALNRLNYTDAPLELDGKFGPQTAGALQAFLESNREHVANIAPSLKEKLLKHTGDEGKALFAEAVPLPRPRPTGEEEIQADVPSPLPRPAPLAVETVATPENTQTVLLPPIAPPRDLEEILAEQAAARMANRPEPRPLEERPHPVQPTPVSPDAPTQEILLHPDLIDRMNTDAKVFEYVAVTYKYADIHGVNPQLLANQFWQESRYDPDAVSPKGAKGISQMMPDTGKSFGLSGSEFTDAEKSIEAGARYMANLEEEYGSQLALVAYNGGEDAIEFVQKNVGTEIGIDEWMEFMTARAIAKDNDDQHPGAWHNETREYATHILSPYWSKEMIDRALEKPENQILELTGHVTALDAINSAFPTGTDLPTSALAYAPSIQDLMKSQINVNIDNMLGIHFGDAASGRNVSVTPEYADIVEQTHQMTKGPNKVGAFGMDLVL